MLGLLLGAALLGACDDSYNNYCEYKSNIDENWEDEDMYSCTDVWRNLHPYGYNPVTGGYNADEDKENGW